MLRKKEYAAIVDLANKVLCRRSLDCIQVYTVLIDLEKS